MRVRESFSPDILQDRAAKGLTISKVYEFDGFNCYTCDISRSQHTSLLIFVGFNDSQLDTYEDV